MSDNDDRHESDRPTTPPSAVDTSVDAHGEEGRIGHYRLLEHLGEGGMGEVLLAEQQAPVRRRVALKLIKRGMDSKQVVARFESERQALAMMSHPNIAAVYDAGISPGGRPYFAMEYVRGIPITDYCDRERLDTRERLRLFATVCDGVQHAHQKGIIHRDLKPSNILVTEQDGTPTPKIIDFGVAKATGQRLTDRTLYTQIGQLVGTLEYMSPEQADLSPLDVDTRTDVYSLGVILYQLLTGTVPFSSKELRGSGLDELRQRIREVEPPRPSTRVRSLVDETVARDRRKDRGGLRRELTGDLDWIVGKALEKERGRRYASAAALADDVRRHLADDPIRARPPSRLYVLRKFVRRHRVGVAAGALVLMALVIGATAAAVGLVRARHAETAATREAETARHVTDLLVGLFEIADPSESRGASITAREVLDSGAGRLHAELAGEPEVRARLDEAIGSVYLNLGLYGDAMPLLRDALETRLELFGAAHVASADSARKLAEAHLAQGEYERAEELYQQALDARRAVLGQEHPAVAESFSDLATVRWRQGDNERAEEYARSAVDMLRRTLPPDDPVIAEGLRDLANVLWSQGGYEESVAANREALDILTRAHGGDHIDIATMQNNLSIVLSLQGRFEEAEPWAQRAIAMARRLVGEEHDLTAQAHHTYAYLLHQAGEHAAAERQYETALEGFEAVFESDHPNVAELLVNLAWLLNDTDRHEEAEPRARRAVEIYGRALPSGHWRRARARTVLGASLAGLGQHAEAERLLVDGYEVLARAAPGASYTEAARRALVALYEAWGRPERAAPYRDAASPGDGAPEARSRRS